MGKTTSLLIAVAALLVAGCTTAADIEDPATAGSTGPAQASTTTQPAITSTADPASSVAPPPHPVAGIWLSELGSAILQFRLDEEPDGSITGVFDSPMEGATDLAVVVTVDERDATIEIPIASAVFEGTVEDDSLAGIWRQSGSEIPVIFTRQDEPFSFDRPQEPKPPFPYTTAEVSFGSDDITLAGTLTIPDGDGPFPVAVLISGSGQQDRDESLMGHKPFLVLADHLARAGIASLRYDDRGVGGSTGNPIGATTADFAEDAALAVEFLAGRDDVGTIGLVGHSEGGLIAPMVAGATDAVEFLVLLAGPGLPGADVLAQQTEDLLRAEGATAQLVDWQVGWTTQVIAVAASEADTAAVEEQIRSIMATAADEAPPQMAAAVTAEGIDGILGTYTDPWMRYFLAYDPRPALEALTAPVLATIGSVDRQVAAESNLPEIEIAVAGNQDATVVEMEGLNHLFQTATTGAVSEYGAIEETMSPEALELVADWITARF
jgi:pimeloyl-ACP methyl ester carboxylesterase